MKGQIPFALALGFGLLHATPAEAQLLGAKGDAVFAAERLFGVRGEHRTTHPPQPNGAGAGDGGEDVNYTTIAFGFAEHRVPYNIPRLAFDYLVINHLSVGGAFGFSLSNGSGNGNDNALPTSFVIAPRVGYLHMFGRVAGIWPRGGFTYDSTAFTHGYKESGLGINLECMFPIVVASHFGFELGVAFDQSLTASHTDENQPSYDISYRSIGLQVGLFGWI
jgi:hypothetical protein